ncbi:hypothetical protein BKH42_03585 [Helicobacter sp. 13S00482-2]|uniref:conjugal transfer protein TraG N-terminal domain-containing protein n=1 Tax=Helicobacter sp. 13S00482-2 TaxID=1476200 RepID=UPI000BA50CE4|nr:conjugal transfer protein TraG N-terminal domain-containing protein [Helicobacter sp. 13S00482-2]PAF53823.1 hypothetical protein BKH42_03585 [Helicobacter sp. 13S00482-2]
MFNKIITLLVFFSSFAFAAQGTLFIDYFPVYTFGDVDLYRQALNIVAMIMGSGDYYAFMVLAFGIGGIVAVLYGRIGLRGLEEISTPGVLNFFSSRYGILLIIVVLGLAPEFRVSVYLQDQRSYFSGTNTGPTKAKIDNVPYLLALPFSLFSSLQLPLINLVDSTFTDINGTRFSQIGYQKNFEIIMNKKAWVDFKRMGEQGLMFEQKLGDYIGDCVFRAIQIKNVPRDLYIGEGRITLESIAPDNFKSKFTNKSVMEGLKTTSGKECSVEAWGEVKDHWRYLKPNFEKRILLQAGITKSEDEFVKNISKDMGLEFLHDSVSGLNGFLNLTLKNAMQPVVDRAIYKDSLGLTGATAELIARNKLKVDAELASGSAIASAATFLEKIPLLFNFYEALALSVFPFFLLSLVIQGGTKALKMYALYFIGLGGVVLERIALAISHDFYTNLTARDVYEKVIGLARNTVVSGGEMVYDQSYYDYIAMQNGLLASSSTMASFLIIGIVISGTLKSFGMIAKAGANAAAAKANMNAEMAKEEQIKSDISQKILETTGLTPAEFEYRQKIMQGIEQNNAAFIENIRFQQAREASAAQIAQGTQQIAASAAIGTDAINNGLGHARTLGTDLATQQINRAEGLQKAGIYDESGNIRNNREGSLYQQGIENQSRISANQTIGIGKEELDTAKMNAIQYGAHAGIKNQIAQGHALRNVYGKDLEGGVGSGGQGYSQVSENNAIDAAISQSAKSKAFNAINSTNGTKQIFNRRESSAEVAYANEMGQGKANAKYLKDNGGIKGVSDIAATNTDMQNIKTAQTVQSAREEFGDVIGGSGKGNYKKTAYQLAAKSHQSMKGEATKIEEDNYYDPESGKSLIELQAETTTSQNLKGFHNSLTNVMAKGKKGMSREKAATEIATAGASEIGEKTFSSVTRFDGKVKAGIVDEDDGSLRSNATITVPANVDKDGNAVGEGTKEINYMEHLRDKNEYHANEEIANVAKFEDTLRANLKKMESQLEKNTKGNFAGDLISNIASDAAVGATTGGMTGAAVGAVGAGVGAAPGAAVGAVVGGVGGAISGTWRSLSEKDEKQANRSAAKVGLNQSLSVQEDLKNGNFAAAGLKGGISSSTIGFGGIVSSVSGTGGNSIQGSQASGVSYSHNESQNYSYGVNASGGSVFAAAAQSMGMGMHNYATMSSSVAAAGAIMGAAGMLMPGGRLGSVLSDVGAIGAESSYAIGVGSAVKLRKNNIKQTNKEKDSSMSKMASSYEDFTSAKGNLENIQRKINSLDGGRKFANLSSESIVEKLYSRQSALNNLKDQNSPKAQGLKREIAALSEYKNLDSAQKRFEFAEAKYNWNKENLSSEHLQEWKKSPLNIDFKNADGIKKGEQMRYEEGGQKAIQDAAEFK